jgi:hypothetical protein
MASYRVREGSITASDSFTALTSLYGQSTTGSVQVPAGTSAIVGIIASVSSDSAGAMDTDIGTAQMSVTLVFA